EGSDLVQGGEGDDIILASADGADDTFEGGEGDDIFAWSPTGSGHDTFDGGAGDDTVALGLPEGADSLQDALNQNLLSLSLTDANGDPVDVTADMFDENGNLTLPEGVSGVLTGADGSTLAFTGVESIVNIATPDLVQFGADTILGGEGGDILAGDSGRDFIAGGDGNDLLFGAGGSDTLAGDNGNDALYGGEGHDELHGGTGNDYLDGGEGHDYLDGGEGNDGLAGGEGHDYLDGGAGNDTLAGGEGNDYLDGGEGNDYLDGGAGIDIGVWGLTGDGNDTFDGGADQDVLYVAGLDAGDSFQQAWQDGAFSIALTDADGNPVDVTDAMFDGNGNLVLPDGVTGVITGPDGNTLTFQNVEAIGNYANQNVTLTAGGDEAEYIETAGVSFVDGGGGDDYIYAGDGASDIHGGAGNDTLDGGIMDGADDNLHGDAGDDMAIWGISGDGSDTFDGGEGNDVLTLDGLGGNESVQDALADGEFSIALTDANGDPVELTDDMFDEYGNLHLPEGVSGVITGPHGDTLTFQNVEIIGNFQNPEGLPTDDWMDGGEGSQTLTGGAGDDTIFGGLGDNADDLALGGDGDDLFVWGVSGDGNDTFDGGAGEDALGLTGLDAASVQAALEADDIQLSLTDAEGNPVAVTADMFDEDGNLILPEGVSGVVTGPDGQTLTFTGVEIITLVTVE
ncbi:MAG: calcium-binding protein, partial [Solirubrobacteraceae bacterium]